MRRQAVSGHAAAVQLEPRAQRTLHDGDKLVVGDTVWRCDVPGAVAPPDRRGRKRPAEAADELGGPRAQQQRPAAAEPPIGPPVTVGAAGLGDQRSAAELAREQDELNARQARTHPAHSASHATRPRGGLGSVALREFASYPPLVHTSPSPLPSPFLSPPLPLPLPSSSSRPRPRPAHTNTTRPSCCSETAPRPAPRRRNDEQGSEFGRQGQGRRYNRRGLASWRYYRIGGRHVAKEGRMLGPTHTQSNWMHWSQY